MLDPETAIAMPRPPMPRSLAPTMGAHTIGHVTGSDAIDGGYMDVVGGTPPPPGRLDSDVSLITDGLDRQESDVSLITDLGTMPRRLSSRPSSDTTCIPLATSTSAYTESIRALVQGYAGGFGTLYDTVKRYLRRWFVSQGGVRVAARHGRAVGRAGQGRPVQRLGRGERVHVARFVSSGVGFL